MRAVVIALLVAAGALLAGSPSTAVAYYQMPIYGLSPANGSRLLLHPQFNRTIVTIRSEPNTYYDLIAGVSFEVRHDTQLGADGTLSNDNPVDYGYIVPVDGRPGYYTATFRNYGVHYDSPGRYYFQFDGYTSNHYFVASPIYHYDLVNPAGGGGGGSGGSDLSMSRGEASSYVRQLIKEHLHRKARHLHKRCKRTGANSFKCRARFWSGRKAEYKGLFRFRHGLQDGQVVWFGRFKGARAKRSCLRHHRFSRCDRRVKWSG